MDRHGVRRRSPLLFLGLSALALFLLAPMVAMLLLGAEPPPAPAASSTAAQSEPRPLPSPSPEVTQSGATLVARRAVDQQAAPGEGLAEQPTAWLMVVDRDRGTPLAGAAIRRVRSGADLAFTDERGLAAVPLAEPEQLAVLLDDYLLRMAPTQPGSTERSPQRVQLLRDRWSLRLECAFVPPAGHPLSLVCVRFRPRGKVGPAPAAIAADPVVARAWHEHELLAGQPACGDVPVQIGAWNQDRVHRLQAGAIVRFLLPGAYEIEAATPDGLCGRAEFQLDAGASPVAVRVPLAPGGFLEGVVLGAGQPLQGAEVSVQGGEPLGLLATSGSEGKFALGPLLPGNVTLLVRHGEHRPAAAGPFAPGAAVRIVLEPLPGTALRGRVRRRPGLEPVAGAQVVWQAPGGVAVAATTGGDGGFVLAVVGTEPGRLAIVGPGCVAYAELVTPGAPSADYDLWPQQRDERVAKGLTACLQGVVVDRGQRPLAGVAVRWVPDHATAAQLPFGRRMLEGAALVLPASVTTGTDGSFVLETDQFGPGQVALVSGAVAVRAEAVAGRVTGDLRLMP